MGELCLPHGPEDLEAVQDAAYLQLSPKERLLDMEISNLISLQVAVADVQKVKENIRAKKATAKLQAASLGSWRDQLRHRL